MNSPYENIPASRFWRTGVAGHSPGPLPDLYKKKFEIGPDTAVGTAGSCFAQHVTRNLRQRKMNIIDVEPRPATLPAELADEYGYDMYSARYGNVYTVRQLLELVRESLYGEKREDIVWEKKGRYYDALRPNIERDGFSSPEEVLAMRALHIAKVAELFRKIDLLVFTFGLTEAWVDTKTGITLPTAPGTVAGKFDPNRYKLKVYRTSEIYDDFVEARRLLKAVNPGLKFLVTVSPVPLTATATPNHVLAATTYSKSTLRSAVGQLFEDFDDIDYFPSYELITGNFTKGTFFSENMRTVTSEGVNAAMSMFFDEHAPKKAPTPVKPVAAPASEVRGISASKRTLEGLKDDEVVCEDELLEAFSR